MKFLLLLCLVGFAAASVYDAILDRYVDDAVEAFGEGLDDGPSLKEILGLKYSQEADEVENDIKTEMKNKLKEKITEVLENFKDHVDHGRDVAHETIDKIKELKDRLIELVKDVHGKGKDLWGNVGDKAKELWEQLKDKFGNVWESKKERRDLQDIFDVIVSHMGELKAKMKGALEELKAKFLDRLSSLHEKLTNGEIKEKIKEFLNEKVKNDMVRNMLLLVLDSQEKSLDKFADVLNNLISRLNQDKSRSARDIKEHLENLKELLKSFHDKAHEKLREIVNWLKERYNKGVIKAKDKIEALKQVCKEVIEHVNEMRDETKRQAIELLLPFKDQLGDSFKKMLEAIKESFNTHMKKE